MREQQPRLLPRDGSTEPGNEPRVLLWTMTGSASRTATPKRSSCRCAACVTPAVSLRYLSETCDAKGAVRGTGWQDAAWVSAELPDSRSGISSLHTTLRQKGHVGCLALG
jgi:hypothetical protein